MKRMDRIKKLKEAGLGEALKESALVSDCRMQHSTQAARGWKFCPHCGTALQLLKTCPICNNNFYSKTAWRMHNQMHRPECPDCKCRSLQILPKGLKYLNPGQRVGSGSKYRCIPCGTIFAWTAKGARKLILDELHPIPMIGRATTEVNHGK